ncbi:MAG: response regulator [Sediminibacterium sp.]|nr:response regulator [Sediminibacterium sp.]MDP1811341.1 response regulator [Sediminibacterium sp.]MDP3128076.1 response regulator [Sediminibacterium sp.]MDP3665168.1 response regulator [Sediminibacterium sp.]
MSTTINRKPVRFLSDPKRVIARFFYPGPETRTLSIIQKVNDMPDEAAKLTLNQSLRDFSSRHRNISKLFQKHFNRVSDILAGRAGDLQSLSYNKRLLIGAYFSSEYSIESAAFFNPSMVEDPDQSGLELGQKRVIVSFRATGEGHISSIVFRGGILDAKNDLVLNPTGRLIEEAEVIKKHLYTKDSFRQKLNEMHADQPIVTIVMEKLKQEFDYNELNSAIEQTKREMNPDELQQKILQTIAWLAASHYEITFSLDTGISDRVIFPLAAAESNGIEDARFTKFTDDDGREWYYATYTAYNGYTIMPKLIETKDFYQFKIMPIYGENAQNKGMALFPRKIDGKYAMLSRIDGVNNFIMYSNDINLWGEAIKIQEPKFPWEFIQVGNCGSPIETKYGWLVITHGVGTMRKYCIGAMLLDLHDPTIVIGELSEPLIAPNDEEREGYVPNVVYSCGSIINNDELVLPYAMSDTSSTYATVQLDELLEQLIPSDYHKTDLSILPRAHILVVEDEVMTQNIISKVLKSENYQVEVAPDGVVALMEIGRKKFDLILSDISMPNFDGYQLLEFIRKNNINIPVVFLSGYTSETSKIKGLSLGAVDYIDKPIDTVQLLSTISKILN